MPLYIGSLLLKTDYHLYLLKADSKSGQINYSRTVVLPADTLCCTHSRSLL